MSNSEIALAIWSKERFQSPSMAHRLTGPALADSNAAAKVRCTHVLLKLGMPFRGNVFELELVCALKIVILAPAATLGFAVSYFNDTTTCDGIPRHLDSYTMFDCDFGIGKLFWLIRASRGR